MTADITAGMAASATQSTAAVKATGLKKGSFTDPQKAWKAAQECENMCAGQFIQQLFAGNKSGMFGGGRMEVVFRSFFTETIAEKASFKLGIAESIYPVLLKNQGADS